MAEQASNKGGLQVKDDRAWQESFWTAQRVAWGLMALLIVAALLGATGQGGPLASAQARSGDAIIDYPRITRWQSNDQLIVRLPSSASGELDLTISPAFVEAFSIETVEPEPKGVQATGAGHRFTFDAAGGAGEKLIVFHVRAEQPALSQTIRVAVDGAPPARLAITVLP